MNLIVAGKVGQHKVLYKCPYYLIYFLINLLFIIKDFDIASYVDDCTPHLSTNNVNGVVKSFEEASTKLFKWFSDHVMKSNAERCHLVASTSNTFNVYEILI